MAYLPRIQRCLPYRLPRLFTSKRHFWLLSQCLLARALSYCSEICSWQIPSAIISSSLDWKSNDHCLRVPSPLSASHVFSSPLPASPARTYYTPFQHLRSLARLSPLPAPIFPFCSTQLIAEPASHTSQLPQDQHSWPQSHVATPSSFLFHFIFPQGNDWIQSARC